MSLEHNLYTLLQIFKSVSISDDESDFEWIRGDKTVSYRVGEENFSKYGKSDIWSLIPGYSIKKESNGSILNFHTENDLLFPFRFNSGELFTIFERIVSLDDTASVTKDIQGDLTGTECSLHRCNDLSHTNASVVEETRSAIEEIETIVSTKEVLSTTSVSSLTTLSTSSHHSNKDSIDLIKDSLLSLLDDLENKEIIINDLENKLNELRDITRSLDYLVSIENNTSVELTSKFNKTTRLVETLLSNKKALLSCKDTASVTISDEENEFEWIRGDKTVSYRVGEENFSKCGKSDIWSLIPNYSIKKESNGSILNFHTENDLLFPFRFTSGELFTIFERIVSLDDTASVTKDIQGDLTGTECSLHRCKELTIASVSVVEEERKTIEEIETIVTTLKTTTSKKEEEVSNSITTGVSSFTTLSSSSDHPSNKDSIDLVKDSLLSLLDDLYTAT